MAERQITITARYDDEAPYDEADMLDRLSSVGLYDVDYDDDQDVEIAAPRETPGWRKKK